MLVTEKDIKSRPLGRDAHYVFVEFRVEALCYKSFSLERSLELELERSYVCGRYVIRFRIEIRGEVFFPFVRICSDQKLSILEICV